MRHVAHLNRAVGRSLRRVISFAVEKINTVKALSEATLFHYGELFLGH